jgi:hypothetical protein
MSRTTRPVPASVIPEGYTWPELFRLVRTVLEANLSVLVRGHPGVGKSALAAELSRALGLELIDIRLAQRDPTDLAGVWFPDRDTRTLLAYPPSWARQAAERPCLVFLDEINAAVTRLHQAAAYQIVLEKRLGELRFHPETRVMAAGNLEEDHAIVTSLSSALNNRFSHFILRADVKTWLEWAAEAGLDPAVIAYLASAGEEALYDPSTQDVAFPTPRSWAMASALLQTCDPRDARRLVASCVGVAHAERFFAWRKVYDRVSPEKILRKGEIPDFRSGGSADPSFVYAATFAVAGWLRSGGELTDAQLPNVVAFLRAPGLDPEYAFLFLRQVHRVAALFERLKAVPAFRQLAGELVGLQAELYQ